MLENHTVTDDGEFYLGDCAEILPSFADNSIDAIITDPPWMLVSQHAPLTDTTIDGEPLRVRSWAETLSMKSAFKPIFAEFARVLKPQGVAMIFCGDVSGSVFLEIAYPYYSFTRFLIWDKGIGRVNPPYTTSHESILLCYNRRWKEVCGNQSQGGMSVLAYSPPRSKTKIHPVEKPIPLLVHLIKRACEPGGIVLDAYAGSFNTCAAARQEGRRFIGIEADETYYARAVAAFGARSAQMTLLESDAA